MKLRLTLAQLMLLAVASSAFAVLAVQQSSDAVTKPKFDPNALALGADDQKQLDLINDRLATMKPQLEKAQKQQADAQAALNEANSFIAQYNQIESIRVAFLFRIAADVCGCKTSELEWSPDGKSVVRKPKKAGATDSGNAKTPER
jgi:hypothetical protein